MSRPRQKTQDSEHAKIGTRGAILSLFSTKPGYEILLKEQLHDLIEDDVPHLVLQSLGDYGILSLMESRTYLDFFEKDYFKHCLNIEHFALFEFDEIQYGLSCSSGNSSKPNSKLFIEKYPLYLVVNCQIRSDLLLYTNDDIPHGFKLESRIVYQLNSKLQNFITKDNKELTFRIFSSFGGNGQIFILFSGNRLLELFEAKQVVEQTEYSISDCVQGVFSNCSTVFGTSFNFFTKSHKNLNKLGVPKISLTKDSHLVELLEQNSVNPCIEFNCIPGQIQLIKEKLKKIFNGKVSFDECNGRFQFKMTYSDKNSVGISLKHFINEFLINFYFSSSAKKIYFQSRTSFSFSLQDRKKLKIKQTLKRNLNTLFKKYPTNPISSDMNNFPKELKYFLSSMDELNDYIKSNYMHNLHLLSLVRFNKNLKSKFYRYFALIEHPVRSEEERIRFKPLNLEQYMHQYDCAFRQRHIAEFPSTRASLPDHTLGHFHMQRVLLAINQYANEVLGLMNSKNYAISYVSPHLTFSVDSFTYALSVPQHCIYDPSYWPYLIHEILHLVIFEDVNFFSLDSKLCEDAIHTHFDNHRTVLLDMVVDILWLNFTNIDQVSFQSSLKNYTIIFVRYLYNYLNLKKYAQLDKPPIIFRLYTVWYFYSYMKGIDIQEAETIFYSNFGEEQNLLEFRNKTMKIIRSHYKSNEKLKEFMEDLLKNIKNMNSLLTTDFLKIISSYLKVVVKKISTGKFKKDNLYITKSIYTDMYNLNGNICKETQSLTLASMSNAIETLKEKTSITSEKNAHKKYLAKGHLFQKNASLIMSYYHSATKELTTQGTSNGR